MAKVAAKTLTGVEATFRSVETATQLKVTGVDLILAGDFADAPDREDIVLRNSGAGVYKRLVLKDNRIVGVVLFGETTDGAWYFDLLRKGTDVSEMRETLIFGQSRQGGAPSTLWRPSRPCRMMPKSAAAMASARARSRPSLPRS